MLRSALLTISLCFSLSACDDPDAHASSEDISFRPWGGIRYDTNIIGEHSFEEITLGKAKFHQIKVKNPYTFTLIGPEDFIHVDLEDLLGAKLKVGAKHKGKPVLAQAEVIDIVETIPTALVLELPNPALEICDIVDGILIVANVGECPH